MANADRVSGFNPVGTISGAEYTAAIRKFYIPASDGTAVAVGDVVKTAGSADSKGVPSVAKAAAGNYVIGVVVAVEVGPSAPNSVPNLDRTYRPASTEAYVYVNTDPELLCEIQEDSVGGALAATSVGLNIEIIDAGVDTTAQSSGMEIDSSTAATTATLMCRLHELVQRPDNEIGTNAKWLVSFNLHELRTQTTGV